MAARVVDMPRVRVGVVGGLEGLKLDQMEDIWRLATGAEEELEQIKDKYVKSFAKPVLDRLREAHDWHGGGGGSGGALQVESS